MCFDTLENRTLFAGVTLLTHGLNGNINGWIAGAADFIQKRAGGTGAASQFVMQLDKAGDEIVVKSFTLVSGNLPLEQTSAGEAIVKLDWSKISGADQNTGPVAQAVVDWLTTHHDGLPDLTSLPIHLVGHSKGGSLVSEISRNLGKRGIWVDQMTGLDPVGGTVMHILGKEYVFGDPPMASYDNVIFVDDYYQTAGQPSGQKFDGSHLLDLSKIVADSYTAGGAHNAVTAYWDGTIDPAAKSAGGMPILDSWYGTTATRPARTQTGYLFSRLDGGERPADGLGTAWGGSASRKSSGQNGSQWANVTGVKYLGDNLLGASYNDRDGGATITFFVDSDRNPLNGTLATLGSRNVSSAVSATSIVVPSESINLPSGTYFIAARITDADGHMRYAYGTGNFMVEAAPQFATSENGVVTVSGTSSADLFNITRTTSGDAPVLQITRNGITQTLSADGITRIVLDTGDGDDTLLADSSCPPIYAFGGAGNDSLSGGGANDTLTGAAGKNTLLGNDGDDRINGSGSRDLIFGGAGADRLYGNGGSDTLDGGGGVDRLFGGDGDDLLLGGGSNDKLYGQAGADTFNGQAGADLVGDRDSLDSLISDAGDVIVDLISA